MLVYGYYFKLTIITMEIHFLLVTEKTEIYAVNSEILSFSSITAMCTVCTLLQGKLIIKISI
jgi:hypothetical protein